ncbi:hypothetical protein N7488_006854 [Penicillium malachiteum]|nr:hypothetical protein N7488_006854 [Penicillium malachiteum]
MRSSIIPAFATLFLLLPSTKAAVAWPLSLLQELEGRALEKRCENPCGAESQYCCAASEVCYTNSADIAECTDSSGWEYYTSTYTLTETDTSTITTVWSSHITATAAAATTTAPCSSELGESTCGTKCCGAAEECVDGQCVAESSSAAVTGTPAARGTSSGWTTATASVTTTEGYIAPVSTDGSQLIGAKSSSSGGLSGGAIAGIVIGTIAGVALLLLLCACICFKEALDGLLAALGMGRRKKKQETIIEERYSHHSHGSRPRPQGGRTWFGTRPAASEVSEKQSKWSGWGTVAIILGALALCLGLRRHKDRDQSDDRTDYTYPSSYYYYSDYTRMIALEDEPEIHDGLDGLAHVHDVND